WFLRTPLLCLRGLAGTLAPGQDSAEAFVDKCWNRGAGVGRPCRWTNRRRAFSGTVLATPARMWLDRVVFWVVLSSRPSFSHRRSCVDDPHPHHRFQPDHLSPPALGFSTIGRRSVLARSSSVARRQRHHPACHGS